MGMKDRKRLEQFKRIVDSIVAVPEGEWEHFVQHLSECTFEKNEYLARVGDWSGFSIAQKMVRNSTSILPWKTVLQALFIH